jgi:hypothetical protein
MGCWDALRHEIPLLFPWAWAGLGWDGMGWDGMGGHGQAGLGYKTVIAACMDVAPYYLPTSILIIT